MDARKKSPRKQLPNRRPPAASSATPPTALSFFSGALGLDIGLERAGFHVLSAAELDKAARETIAANRPGLPVLGDVFDYDAAAVRKVVGDVDIDVIVGGPPCQAFSTAGKRQGFSDNRGNVFLHFIGLILDLQPRFAVIENVRGLLSAPMMHRPHAMRGPGFPPLAEDESPGGALQFILAMLKGSGYGVSFNLYNAANFGAPQVRERVVLLCSRDGERLPFLEPTHAQDGAFGLKPWRTLREAVGDLGGSEHTHVNFPEKRLKYYRMLKEGQNWRNLPKKVQEKAMGGSFHAGGGKTGFYRRLAWDEPAPTLVTHPAMPATDLAHPELERPLSVQEYKRIQGFPDDWQLCGRVVDQYRQVGNAVPVPLGEAIGKALLKHIEGQEPSIPMGFPFSRYKGTSDLEWIAARNKKTGPTKKQLMLRWE